MANGRLRAWRASPHRARAMTRRANVPRDHSLDSQSHLGSEARGAASSGTTVTAAVSSTAMTRYGLPGPVRPARWYHTAVPTNPAVRAAAQYQPLAMPARPVSDCSKTENELE